MPREISNRFCLIEPSLISSSLRMREHIFLPDESPVFISRKKLTFGQTPSKSDSGIIWSQTFQGVSSDRKLLEYNRSRMYVGFFLTDGSLKVIGTADDVPVIQVTPYEQGQFVLNVSFDSTQEVIL